MAVELKGDDEYLACFVAVEFFAGFGVARDVGDFGVFEDGSVEVGGFFGIAVEPEAWGDFVGDFDGHGGWL